MQVSSAIKSHPGHNSVCSSGTLSEDCALTDYTALCTARSQLLRS